MKKNDPELMSTYEQELPGADVDLSQYSSTATSGEQVSSCTLAECLEPWLRLVFTRINTVSLQISLQQDFASTSHTHIFPPHISFFFQLYEHLFSATSRGEP